MTRPTTRAGRRAASVAAAQDRLITGAAPTPPQQLERLPCPDCPQIRSTPETLRVHRWLAHGIREFPS